MSMVYNVGSLALGLLAMMIPVIGLLRRRYTGAWAAVSFLGSNLALMLQLMEAARLNRVDISGLLDTINAVAFLAVALTLVVLVLNLAALTRRKKETDRK